MLLLFLITAVLCQLGQYCKDEVFCVYGYQNDKQEIVFTLHSSQPGYASIAIGSMMNGSLAYYGFNTPASAIVVKSGVLGDHSRPIATPEQKLSTTSLKIPSPEWAKLAFSFSIPIQGISPTTQFIWAIGKRTPKEIDSNDPVLGFHTDYGVIPVTDFTGKIEIPSSQGSSSIITATMPVTSTIGTVPITTQVTSVITTAAPVPSGTPSTDVSKFCDGTNICVYGQPDSNGNVVFTVHSSAKGWAGFGIGSSMAQAKIYVGWKSGTGYTVISTTSTSHDRPRNVSPQDITVVPCQLPTPQWANLAFCFSRPINQAPAVTPTSTYIYAMADARPASDSPDASFGIHDLQGVFSNVDFTRGGSTGVPQTSQAGGPPPTTIPGGTGGGTGGGAGSGSSNFCDGTSFCVYGEPDGTGSITFTVFSSFNGWAGFGIGNSMFGSHIYIGWKSGNSYTVISTTSNGHVRPQNVNPQDITVLPNPSIAPPSWAKLAFSFKRPIQSSPAILANNQYIYAYSNVEPGSGDPGANLALHTGRGVISNVDFTKAGSTGAGSTSGTPAGGGKPGTTGQGDGSSRFCDGTKFCVYGQPNGTNINFTIHAAAKGWAGFGIGSSMTGSQIYIGWKSQNGYTVISTKSTGHEKPKPVSPKDITVYPAIISPPTWANLAFSFSRPIRQEPAILPSNQYIYAYADSQPSGPGEDANYGIHDAYGVINGVDFTKAGSAGNVITNGTSTSPPGTEVSGNRNSRKFCEGEIFCVYGDKKDDRIIFTIFGSSKGYVGFGVGSKMEGAAMYIGWTNSTNGTTVSSTLGIGHSQPPALNPQDIQVVSLNEPRPTWAKIAYSFSRPLVQSRSSIVPGATYIYAYADSLPTGNVDTVNVGLALHTGRGIIRNLDFTTAGEGGSSEPGGNPVVQLPAGWTYDRMLLVHGIVMFIAWGVFPFVAIFIARYMKFLGHLWYQLHFGIFLVFTLGGSLAGFLVAYLYRAAPHFDNFHAILGLIVLCLLPLQIILGFVIDRLYDHDRPYVPWWDQLHHYLGRFTLLCAIIAIPLGIVKYSDYQPVNIGIYAGYGIYIVLAFSILFVENVFKTRTLNTAQSAENIFSSTRNNHLSDPSVAYFDAEK